MMEKWIKKQMGTISFIGVTIMFMCICVFFGVSCRDKISTDVKTLQAFIILESDLLGLPQEDTTKLIEENITVSSLISAYESYRLNLELNNLLPEESYGIDCSLLTNFDTLEAHSYVSAYIRCLGWYDVMLTADKNSDDYWEVMYNAMYNVRPYEQLKADGIQSELYRDIPVIQATAIAIGLSTFILTLFLQFYWYIEILKCKKRDKEWEESHKVRKS